MDVAIDEFEMRSPKDSEWPVKDLENENNENAKELDCELNPGFTLNPLEMSEVSLLILFLNFPLGNGLGLIQITEMRRPSWI